jgi:hypothetical protein
MTAMSVSRRARQWLEERYALMDGAGLAQKNPFHVHTRPEGCINLGTAENSLMFPELTDKVSNLCFTSWY